MIQDSFLKMYVSWFKEYRRHIVPASVPFDPNQELFKRDIFLTVSKTAERRVRVLEIKKDINIYSYFVGILGRVYQLTDGHPVHARESDGHRDRS